MLRRPARARHRPRPGARHQRRRPQRRDGRPRPDARRDRPADRAVADGRPSRARCTATGRCARCGGRCRPAPTSTPPSRCSSGWARSSATTLSRTCRSGSRCARPASSGPPSTGSTPARWWTRSSRAPPCPGCCRRRKVGDEHYLDGGIVNSIPLGRAVQLGADPGVRAAGGPDRPAADRAAAAVGGGPGVLRDRPPAPVQPRDGRAARRRRGARAARPRARPPATTRCSATATSPASQERIDATYEASRGLPGRSCEPRALMLGAAAAGGRARRGRPSRS